ncbi:Z1 domain-containing protein [Cytobacillus sp. S13-E01]|uniref:Z1 domain-containing protein n=1 Tax=Cytobacillus sp. S13-E01 TaxID=3031326 RepID=UPI0023D7D358|nr:Z1 domain-containing protein [Cytobacillus sp. S13-E01]MDF0728905.1 Z1 domain-containing protein [Cytobacillus sp. S13-E01]
MEATKLVNTRGYFYNQLAIKNNYDDKTKQCIENTVVNLLENDTSVNRPGMLLGKIQSGKTRTFIGITALSFDNGYDLTIVLTKGTRALAQQTYERLKKEFEEFYREDEIQIFDIMNLPDNLSEWELDQKLIMVVKKETNNLKRLYQALFESYPSLSSKKVLIIDDEADFASIGFTKTKQEITEIKIIAGQIDEIRKNLTASDFLQVTATPYSLYLQPEDLKIEGSSKVFKPVKPAFTELVPVPDAYIGGDYYFEESENEDSIAYYIYEPIIEDELQVLKKPDRRKFKIEDALTSPKVKSLRHSVINFIVGGTIRRMQEQQNGARSKKYSFIVHTEQGKAAHEWQETVVNEIKVLLRDAVDQDPVLLSDLLRESYDSLKRSLMLLDCEMPTFEKIKYEVIVALRKDYLTITKVNSEKDVSQLLDDSGQLKLRTPLNIFIGGQILDRGITIGNLIGFYYGRNPKTFQQDTVLQHSRMFGYRPLEDLAVTRFYTTSQIYDVMKKMHEFDSGLRNAFERGTNENGVVFIQKDDKNLIIPCSPNKLLLSKTTTLKPLKRLLPIGFQTGYKTNIGKVVNYLDTTIDEYSKSSEEPFLLDLENAIDIINQIKVTHDNSVGEIWDEQSFISSMEYLSRNTDSENAGQVWCIVRKNRNIGRIRMDGKYEDAPDTPKGEKGELKIAKQIAKDIPALILLRQNGEEGENKWRGSAFWWPVLVTPENTKTIIYSSN